MEGGGWRVFVKYEYEYAGEGGDMKWNGGAMIVIVLVAYMVGDYIVRYEKKEKLSFLPQH